MRKIVLEGIQDGSIVARDEKLTVFTIMGSINWIPSWYSSGGPHRPKEIAEVIADIFTRGLRESAKLVPAGQSVAKSGAPARRARSKADAAG